MNILFENIQNKSFEGGLLGVPETNLKFFLNFIYQQGKNKINKRILKSVQNFGLLIKQNPVLRMNWQHGIKQCSRTLQNKTGDDVINMLDTACKTPPAFINNIMIGLPFNAIFVQFMQTNNGKIFFSHNQVNLALKNILNDYNSMLQSPQSLKYMNKEPQFGWFSPAVNQKIHNQWYKCDLEAPNYGYKNWNEWFLRQFKEGMRPIGAETPQGIKQDNVIVNACESTPLKTTQPIYNVLKTNDFWLKDNLYSLNDMFGGEKYNKEQISELFEGGTIYQAYLSSLSYHRWHAPVDGIIEDLYSIDGTYFLDRSSNLQYHENCPCDSQTFLSAVSARLIVLIKATNCQIGKIGIIFIGMTQVSSCVATVKKGDTVKKGQQLGYFMFGGSSHAMVFQKQANLKFIEKQKLYSFNSTNQIYEPIRQNLCSYLAHVQNNQN